MFSQCSSLVLFHSFLVGFSSSALHGPLVKIMLHSAAIGYNLHRVPLTVSMKYSKITVNK